MDFKSFFLDYFQKCFNENIPININEMRSMAYGKEKSANSAFKELLDEGIITGKQNLNVFEPDQKIENYHSLELTQFGIQRIQELNKKTDNYTKENEDFIQKIIKNENERISKLSKKEKEKEIKIEILNYFEYLCFNIKNYPNGQITNKELKEKLKNIVKRYYEKVSQIFAQRITKSLLKDGYINFLYATGNEGFYSIDNLLTDKAKEFLKEQRKQKNLEIEKYCHENNIKFPQIALPQNIYQALTSINNSATFTAINQINAIQKIFNDAKMQKSLNTFSKELTKISQIHNNFYTTNEKTGICTFEGILGQNCGDVISPTSQDYKSIFKIDNGITVLRGFAKSSDIAAFSQADNNYQRNKNIKHINSLSEFIKKMKTSAKYLPEVTLVTRGYLSLQPIQISGNLTNTQKTEIEKLNYYKLSVKKEQLYRIDGNHRLEALKNDNYYIPFSIIIWEDTDINPDDEAFLFYFLNSKAKKLTTEENLKGLVNATTWKPHELLEANKYLPHLQYLEKQIKTNKFLSSYFCNNEPIKNIAEILEKINENIEFEHFKEILSLTNELLILDKWNELKQFDFYCQLIFYIAFKNKDKNECKSILDNINNWVKKYKFDNTTFDNPIMLYRSAEKTNITRPIKVFVAMPYYDDEIIEDFNDQLKKLSEELIKKYPLLENRFEIYEVMKHRGYAIDIQSQIIEQIKSANIFIADISEHTCKKGTRKVDCHANPNVMYELGIAKGQSHTEIILLKNKKDKIEVPADIITKYHNKFEFDKKVSMRKKLFEAIENILKDKFNII